LPSYAFDACLDKNYSYVYWRNPHDLITKINAVANKTLHSILVNKSLAESIKKIEKNLTDTTISIVQVSTFRCGPDSVITPTINNITKNIPSLFIQSDAMIKELAHLENRINTHVNQITKKLSKDVKNKFNIKKIDDI
jgi:predicted nucleotide-binding protein (sugar kinase/HSP70/actin superfamily)